MLDKQGVYDCLRDHHIDFEITDHAPLFSMDDKPNVELPYPGVGCEEFIYSRP